MNWLGDVVICAGFHRLHGGLDCAIGRQDNHRYFGKLDADLLQQVEPGRAWQVQVRNDDVRGIFS